MSGSEGPPGGPSAGPFSATSASRDVPSEEATDVVTIEVETDRRQQLVDITERVEEAVASAGVEEGACVLWSMHTTAGLTVNESADPDVARDIEEWLEEAAPRDAGYRHREGNADSHVKTTLVGPGVTLVVSGGRPVLGRWQGVFLCEFDGPRTRRVALKVLAS